MNALLEELLQNNGFYKPIVHLGSVHGVLGKIF